MLDLLLLRCGSCSLESHLIHDKIIIIIMLFRPIESHTRIHRCKPHTHLYINMLYIKLVWGSAQNNRLAGLWARPRRHRGPDSLFRPTWAKRTCLRSNSSSDIAKSGSKVRSSYCSPPSKYVKIKETQNISAKAVTTTLNAPQLLSWPH